MEKNTARIGTGNKRLLAFRQLARPAAIFFFCCAAAMLYGRQSEHLIELKIDGTELSIDREFEIEVIIKQNAPYLQDNSDMPRLLLEHEAYTAALIQSSTIPERNGLHLRYRYRFNKTGRFRFEPKLQWKRQTVELAPLDLTVHRPLLSEHTPFFWKLYSLDGSPIAEDATLEQGREYILCLTAAFYSIGYTERYLHALQTASVQPDGRRPEQTGAAIRDTHGELPLPVEILRIGCTPSENAALKPIALAELPFGAAVLTDSAALPNTEVFPDTGSSAVAMPSKSVLHEAISDEHYILAAFSLIPLRIGVQSLPQAQILFAPEGGEAFSVPAAYHIERQTASEIAAKGDADDFTAAAFQTLPDETQYSSHTMTELEKCATAKQIADYRKQEAAALFAPAIRHEREKLEAALEIAHPLPLYPRLLGILAMVISGVLLIGAAVCGFHNKKRLMALLIIAGLCSGGFTVVIFRLILRPQGVYVGCSSSDSAVRRIPERSGSSIYRLSAGESVIIIRRALQWYYIETSGGVIGWISAQSLIQYN